MVVDGCRVPLVPVIVITYVWLCAVGPANPPPQPVIINVPPSMLIITRSIATDVPIRLRLVERKHTPAAKLIGENGNRGLGFTGIPAVWADVRIVMTVDAPVLPGVTAEVLKTATAPAGRPDADMVTRLL